MSTPIYGATAADLHDPGLTPVEAAEAEVAVETAPPAEIDLPDGAVAVPFADTTIHVLDQNDWRSSDQTALTQGRFDDWATECLATDDDVDLWFEVNPTVGQIKDFFVAHASITGNDAGKSRASRRGSPRDRLRKR